MPKTKTHKGTAKRIKKTGSGKLLKESANKRHLLEYKSSRRLRRISGVSEVAEHDKSRIKRLLKI